MGLVRALLLALLAALLVPAAAASAPEEALPGAVTALAPQLPAGFSDAVVLNVPAPTAVTWTPDGRMLVTSKPGRVIVRAEDGTRTTALDITTKICDDLERGLVGVAVDPRFATNHYVYLYYTHKAGASCTGEGRPPANRVSRFVLGDDDLIARSTETVIVDHIVSLQGHHIAGDLEFGEDGFLYISVGDGVCSVGRDTRCGPTNDNSLKRYLPHGKILRVTSTGQPVASNPYADAPGARRCTRPDGVPPGTGPCKEIFASGFRNPFRFARKPGTNTFYVNDVGLDTWEEVDRLRKGGNYGWNVREGHCRRDSTTDCGKVAGFINPIHDYRHGDCRSVTGGAFVPTGVWPGWGGSYLYSDFACGKIFRLQKRSDGTFRRTTFVSGADGPVHLRFGPYDDGSALYYLSYFTDSVHRISRSEVNTAPVADFAYRPDGLTVAFDGAASRDDDANDLVTSWSWDFGDGTTAETTGPTTTHTYATGGPVQVSLTVTDTHGATAERTRTVQAGEHPPSVAITAPPADTLFAVGDAVALQAQATDTEDGALPGSAVTWTIRLRHGNHFHPYLGPVTGGSVATTYPAPEDLAAARTSHLVVTATAVDSAGLETTVTRKLLPRTVRLTFRTSPDGGRLSIQGERRTTPLTVRSWVGYVFGIGAPDQEIGGVPYEFVRWSDGGARRHDITTPSVATDYVARFRVR